MKKLRVAIIGAGHLGTIHTRLLQKRPDVEIVGVVDPNAAALARIQAEFDVPTFDNLPQVLPDLDAAIIAAPSSLHYEIASMLIRQGIHILVEKPLATDLAQATILEQLAHRFGVIVAVGHVERFNPAFRAVQDQLGELRFVDAQRLSGYSYRSTDIGAVLDLMIHDLDLVASMTDSDVVRVEAFGHSYVSRNEDFAQARLEFDCGFVANFTAFRCHTKAVREMRLLGDRRLALVDLSSHRVELFNAADPDGNQIDGEAMSMQERQLARDRFFEDVMPRQVFDVPPCNAIEAEQADWLESIRTGRRALVDATVACRSLAWAEQILQQIQQQRLADEPSILRFPHAA